MNDQLTELEEWASSRTNDYGDCDNKACYGFHVLVEAQKRILEKAIERLVSLKQFDGEIVRTKKFNGFKCTVLNTDIQVRNALLNEAIAELKSLIEEV